MADISVENYKKAVQRAVDRWGEKVAKIAKELDDIADELKELEEIDEPSDEQKKQIEKLKKDREACRKAMDKAATELKLDLMLLEPPTTKKDDKDLVNLPKWLKEIIKKKGIPLSKHVTLQPDASFDLKAMKLKSFSLKLEWEF